MVIDDAAHSNAATRTAFQALWPHVQPGGIYIIEDLVWSRNPRVQGAKNKEVMPFVDTIKEWIDQLLIDPAQTFSGSSDGRFEESRLGSSQAEVIEKRFPELLSKDNVYRVQDPLPLGVQFINCFTAICVIGKKVLQTKFSNPFLQ